jgi:ABC-type multidrug transport system fused ATPase/permease subunit
MSEPQEKDPNKSKRITKNQLRDAKVIFSYIKPYLLQFIGAMLLLIFGSLIFMLLTGLPGEMANTAIGKPKFNLGITVRQFKWIFLIILIVQGVMSYARTQLFTIVSEKSMADLRKDLYDKIITQQMFFFEERRVGELSSRITADVEKLQSVFSITLAELIRQIVILIAGVIIIVFWTPRLSLIMLLTFPVIVILAMIFGRYIRKLSKKRQDELANTNTIVEETFQSFQIVKSFANEQYESERYGKAIDKIVNISLKFGNVKGMFFAFIITILFGGIFFILWQGALLLEQGKMSAGDLFSFIIYTGVIGGAIASFGNLYTEVLSALGATERIVEILHTPSEVEINKAEKSLDIKGDISFKNVGFAYPSRKDVTVLKNINFEVKNGAKIAFIGQSGGGKSTIVQLLMRFYNVNSGHIEIDGTDITSLDITALRKNIGIVPQEVILFGGTIKENIGYGQPGASDEQIKHAAILSNSWEFIEAFPDGMETIVGDRGIKLSGGQRQRIAIARAILKNPKILILDEATSALDAESEKLVQDALEKLMVDRTTIIIAHRLATIKDVDTIFVIDDGKIIEKGNHTELIAKENGAYQALAKLQFES